MLCFQGAGLVGIYACAYLKEKGFEQVYCTDISPKRLLHTHKFGATPISHGEFFHVYTQFIIYIFIHVLL